MSKERLKQGSQDSRKELQDFVKGLFYAGVYGFDWEVRSLFLCLYQVLEGRHLAVTHNKFLLILVGSLHRLQISTQVLLMRSSSRVAVIPMTLV